MVFNWGRNNATAAGFILFLIIVALNGALVTSANGGVSGFYTESIAITVDCDTARINLACTLMSLNSSLIHYPSPVNLNDSHLVKCLSVAATFSLGNTTLVFQFNDTDEGAARSNADAMISSMNTAFGVSFAHLGTYSVSLPYTYVVVVYEADPKPNLSTFLAGLKTGCFSPDVGGFSNVLPTLFTHAENKTITIMAINYTTEWDHTFIAEYDAPYSAGSGSHTVNVLYWLGASTLEPSQQAWLGIYYVSSVALTVDSSETLTFTSCVPDRIYAPLMSAGWYIASESGNTLSGVLYFGNSNPMWDTITFTFEGTVVPEFTLLSVMLLLAFSSAMLLYLRKRSRAIA